MKLNIGDVINKMAKSNRTKRRKSIQSFIVPDSHIEYDSDYVEEMELANKKQHINPTKWQELIDIYKGDKNIVSLLRSCKDYEESQEVTMKEILSSGLPAYIVCGLIHTLERMDQCGKNTDEYYTLRSKIQFYLNRGVPKGPINAFVTDNANVDLVNKGFDDVRNNFPSFDEMPESAVDLMTAYNMDPYTSDHNSIYRYLNSMARSRGNELRKQILKCPDESMKGIMIKKFQSALHQDEDTREKIFSCIRYILQLPTEKPSMVVNRDVLRKTYDILENEIYGMEHAKSVIMSNLETLNGKKACIALIGPPGVGKTSFLRSLGRALGRPLFKINIPGAEVHHLKGGSPLYIGSQPGKIAEAFKETGSKAPIILLDELDKMSRGHHGLNSDVPSLISELLDETQNTFEDIHLGIDIDISNVLFVISMNTMNIMEKYLRDRMLIIKIKPPTDDEKVKILYEMKLKPMLQQFELEKKIRMGKDTIKHIVHIASSYNEEEEDEEDSCSGTGMRKSLRILETTLKKLRMFITIGTKHTIVPKEIRGFKTPFTVTPRVLELLWHETSENIDYYE